MSPRWWCSFQHYYKMIYYYLIHTWVKWHCPSLNRIQFLLSRFLTRMYEGHIYCQFHSLRLRGEVIPNKPRHSPGVDCFSTEEIEFASAICKGQFSTSFQNIYINTLIKLDRTNLCVCVCVYAIKYIYFLMHIYIIHLLMHENILSKWCFLL